MASEPASSWRRKAADFFYGLAPVALWFTIWLLVAKLSDSALLTVMVAQYGIMHISAVPDIVCQIVHRLFITCILSLMFHHLIFSILMVSTIIYLSHNHLDIVPILWKLAAYEQCFYRLRSNEPVGRRGLAAWFHDMIELFRYGLFDQFTLLYERNPGQYPIFAYLAGDPSILIREATHNLKLMTEHGLNPTLRAHVMSRMEHMLGYSLLTTAVVGAQRVRRRTNPHLNGRTLDFYETETMNKVIENVILPRWQKAADAGQPIELCSNMVDISTRVLIMSLLGLTLEEIPDEIVALPDTLFSMLRSMILEPIMIPLWIPTPRNSIYNNKMKQLRDFVDSFVDKQKEASTMLGTIIRDFTTGALPTYRQFLTKLSVSLNISVEILDQKLAEKSYERITQPIFEDSDGNKSPTGEASPEFPTRKMPICHDMGSDIARKLDLPDIKELQTKVEVILVVEGTLQRQKVLEEMSSILVGGAESTTGVLIASFFYLAREPQYAEQLRMAFAERNPDGSEKSLKEHCNSGYAWKVMQEALRMNSPALVHNHPIPADVMLPGVDGKDYLFRHDQVIWMSQFLLQHDPSYWSNPKKFDPDRWNEKPVPGSYFPFGIGARQCLGRNYALREIAACLKTMLAHFDLSLADNNFQITYSRDATLRPTCLVEVQLKTRK